MALTASGVLRVVFAAALLIGLAVILRGAWWYPSLAPATKLGISLTQRKVGHLVEGVGPPLEAHKDGSGQNARVAVMVIGQWRGLTDPLSKKHFTQRERQKLTCDNITSVIASHSVHVLQPLMAHGLLPEYLLCVDEVQDLQHPQLVESWGFPAQNQQQRILECVKLVRARELQRNISYAFFVRLRPDLLVLTDLPVPTDQFFCIWTRFRMAANVSGLTNEHLSWCYCGNDCCNWATTLREHGASFMLDDTVMVAPRRAFLHLWENQSRLGFVPWKFPAGFVESNWTRQVLEAGVRVCPLAIRVIPVEARSADHLGAQRDCGYLEGSPAKPQTRCGSPSASVSFDNLPWTLTQSSGIRPGIT